MPLCAAVIQMCSRQDVEQNLSVARALVEQAAARGAQLAVLPENFAYIRKLEHKVQIAESLSEPGPILRAMQEAARATGLHLLLGGMPIRAERTDRFHNTAVLLDPRGHILASYRKIHLFDINLPGVVFNESSLVMPGEEPVVTDLLGARLGFSICYDLRFPELYRELSRRGATVLAVPAAFTLHTGQDHWLPLLRARAIENQCYVLAAGQHGAHTESRTSYGKSCIIDPWGAVIAQVSDGDGVAAAMLDLEYLAKVRRELPALTHRRLG
jgi:deaminated glutathione amidase